MKQLETGMLSPNILVPKASLKVLGVDDCESIVYKFAFARFVSSIAMSNHPIVWEDVFPGEYGHHFVNYSISLVSFICNPDDLFLEPTGEENCQKLPPYELWDGDTDIEPTFPCKKEERQPFVLDMKVFLQEEHSDSSGRVYKHCLLHKPTNSNYWHFEIHAKSQDGSAIGLSNNMKRKLGLKIRHCFHAAFKSLYEKKTNSWFKYEPCEINEWPFHKVNSGFNSIINNI